MLRTLLIIGAGSFIGGIVLSGQAVPENTNVDLKSWESES